MAHLKWCVISDVNGPIASEWAEEGTVSAPNGGSVAYFDVVDNDQVAAIAANHVCPKVEAMKALDASAETGALKTIIEYLQSKEQ